MVNNGFRGREGNRSAVLRWGAEPVPVSEVRSRLVERSAGCTAEPVPGRVTTRIAHGATISVSAAATEQLAGATSQHDDESEDDPTAAAAGEHNQELDTTAAMERDTSSFHEQGYSPPVNAAEAAIFQIFLHHHTVPVEQRHTVRAQLDQLAHQDNVRQGYQTLASTTRKKINRLGRS